MSYLLLVLKEKAFKVTPDGKKVSFLGVYHAKTWETQKQSIEKDFKSDGVKRVVIATCALGMGINFPKVRYVVEYGPPTNIVDLMQQAGRGGRDGGQAHCITYYTKGQLSRCGKEVKAVVQTEKCQRVALYQYFSDSTLSLLPSHSCCSNCRQKCHCSTAGNNYCEAATEVFMRVEDNKEQVPTDGKSRKITATDENDLRLALMELKSQFSANSGLFFDPTISHGFTDHLIEDIVKDASNIFSFEYLRENFTMYSTQYVLVVLKVFQEFFKDIADFAQQMEVLGFLNSEVTHAEYYIQAMELSTYGIDCDSSDELEVELPEFNIQF